MTVGILTEKPSAARNFAKALGGMSGSFGGESYVIAHARGHLYEFADPHKMVSDAEKAEKYRKWDLENLPWDPQDLDWHLEVIKDAKDVAADVRSTLGACDEIAIATDVDPTGEGGMIAVNAILELGLDSKKISRMYFTDEAEKSLQKAFSSRTAIPSLTDFDEYRKAQYRSKWDLLSMQFTRIATNMARASGQDAVLRQGRLKSAMVKLVGDQLKAHNDYVKKPFFQNRFRDENGVVYTDPEEPRFDKADQVPQEYSASAVVVDSKTKKTQAPPKLLDLAALSSLLVGKGVKAKQALQTYQKMYEDQVVSYPRTEDKTITPEQFNELAPLIDDIAKVVGVDAGLLTHRSPRKTHVKPQGAHGANRPGPKVPASLDAVEQKYGKAGRLIYETLAKNYLAIVAEDYEYEQQKGHIQDYPSFKGTANVPLSAGWRAVFDPDAADKDGKDADGADGDEDENSAGLGTNAEPFVYEGANKRPEHPSMKWLMKQLEKRDVGTGATRTSTYSEVTSEKAKYPLLVEKGRKLTLAAAGEMSWHLLPGTRIGDLGVTEKVYQDMREIAEGTADPDERLAVVADWVREDIETMKKNVGSMRSTMGLKEQSIAPKEKATGIWAATGQEISFNREWAGHRFDDDEVAALLAGEVVSFSATSKDGRVFDVYGRLAEQTYNGRKYIAFAKEGFGKLDAQGNALPPSEWCQHRFTDEEIETLKSGGTVEATDFVSKAGKPFSAKVAFEEEKPGEGKRIVLKRPDGPTSWCGHEFTASEKAKLMDGEKVVRDDWVSKAGKRFGCAVTWSQKERKIIPEFGSDDEPPRSWAQRIFTEEERKKLAAGEALELDGFVSKKGKKFGCIVRWMEEDGKKKIVPEFSKR